MVSCVQQVYLIFCGKTLHFKTNTWMLLDYRNRSMHCSLIIPYSNVSSGAKQLNILFLCWRLHLHLILLSQKTKFASYKTSLLPNDLLIVIKQYHSKKQSTVAKNYKSLSILQHQTWSAILLKHRIELLPTPWSHQTLFTTVLFWFITYTHRCEYIQYAALLYRSANKYQPDLSPLGCKNLSEVEVRGCGASFNHRPITATEPRVV